MTMVTQRPLHIADILRSMADAVITIDAAKRVTSMNAAAEAMIGITEAEALGRKCGELVGSEICGTNCPVTAVWERGETAVNFNVTLETRSGGRIPVSVSTSLLKNEAGEKIGVIHSFRDIRHVLCLFDALQRSEEEIARKENRLRTLQRRERLGDIIGRSAKMQEIFDLVQIVAKSDVTVLIQGESGTGKALVASTIHAVSHRASSPFITVSCATLPASLLESELFGHVRGAFTGAIKDRAGRFELADRGTIFLDEVGEMDPSVQVNLLRVLQEREFERVGGTRTVKVDVRVIAASNRDLHKALQDGRFREDLFYRLNVVPILLPPLRERKEDIPLLVRSILAKLAAPMKRKPLLVSPEAMKLLVEYDWPGNVRELENALEFAWVRTAGDTLVPRSFPPWITGSGEAALQARKGLVEIVAAREREEILKKLTECQGKLSETAKALGVGRTTLWRKMKRYQIAKA